MKHDLIKADNYLLVVDDSLTIGKGYALNTSYKLLLKYNTDQHLAYDNDIVKKIIAHLPLNGAPYLDGVDRLPPMGNGEEDDIEVLANKMTNHLTFPEERREGIVYGYNIAREKYKFTEEDMLQAAKYGYEFRDTTSFPEHNFEDSCINNTKQWLQSLQQPKLPTAFECEKYLCFPSHCFRDCEIVCKYPRPKTITNSDGRTEWVGKYIYE